ncbi:YaiI/YqxD family protein [Catenovulum sp. SM1970]|uniref:YaiI/YqxD family protein n=1 Tax=Marinifaba aquimaris TaxID=2741323 RepID=UPI001572BCA7|nr:YaiI/YqxD family protein [Marinifaba aquimaris]NTS77315.1 YaiI/YqxD family protein [Marinifaba aquimaris]
MAIWVDADACPVVIKQIIFKACNRTKIKATFVANQYLSIPQSPYLSFIQVEKGFDIADNKIVEKVSANDLVITQDIPLADEVITKGALALSPRGSLFSKENIKSRLNMRDFMETLRSSGVQTGGPAALDNKDKQAFANELDKYLARNKP